MCHLLISVHHGQSQSLQFMKSLNMELGGGPQGSCSAHRRQLHAHCSSSLRGSQRFVDCLITSLVRGHTFQLRTISIEAMVPDTGTVHSLSTSPEPAVLPVAWSACEALQCHL